jgi:hypothetical protein
MIWKLKIPIKLKIFVCYLQKGVVLAKDNLAKKTGQEAKNVVAVIVMSL